MDRRTFMGAAAANLFATPLAAMGQQTEVHRLGYLSLGRAPTSRAREWDPTPLRDLGWIEGKNLVFEIRYANDKAQLEQFAADLVQLKVEIIVTSGTDAALAAKAATTRIPIVLLAAGDPVGAGLVSSLSRPGGNITGFSVVTTELRIKRLEVLHELLPAVQRVGELVNPNNPLWSVRQKEYEDSYRSLGLQLFFIDVAMATELGSAFAELSRRRAQALIVPEDNLFDANSDLIMRTALERGLPTMVGDGLMVRSGGLVSYGVSPGEGDHRLAYFIDKILRGAKPADLPVAQASKFRLLINIRTAKALGITIPQALMRRAEEIIQ